MHDPQHPRVWPNFIDNPDVVVGVKVEICDECGAEIPDTEMSMINPHHERSCSLHPDNDS
jgi:transposase